MAYELSVAFSFFNFSSLNYTSASTCHHRHLWQSFPVCIDSTWSLLKITKFMFAAFIIIHFFWYRALPVWVNRKSTLKWLCYIKKANLSIINEHQKHVGEKKWSEQILDGQNDWTESPSKTYSTISPQIIQTWMKCWISTVEVDNTTFHMCLSCHVQPCTETSWHRSISQPRPGNKYFPAWWGFLSQCVCT